MEERGFWDGWGGMVAILAVAALVFGAVLGAMALYAGTWPPLSVVESNSMQHSDQRSSVGVIDTGDLVIVRSSDGSDVVTYVEGYQTGHRMFGDYGDVIIYRPLGSEDRTPIIHRAVVFLEPVGVNQWSASALASFPDELWQVEHGDHDGMRGVLTLLSYGHASIRIDIDLDSLSRHAGFITHGDNNHQNGIGYVDQMVLDSGQLVRPEWVMSKAAIEIPWIGSLSLIARNVNVDMIPPNSIIATVGVIVMIIVAPFVAEWTWRAVRR